MMNLLATYSLDALSLTNSTSNHSRLNRPSGARRSGLRGRAGTGDWRADGDIKRSSIGLCGVLRTTAFSALTDCDADGGSLGGALLKFPFHRGGPSTIVGITVGGTYGAGGRKADCDDTTKCATEHLAITADIIEKINELSAR